MSIDRESFARTVARRISHAEMKPDSSTVMAITGPWGSGKSTLMKLIYPTLSGDRTQFNPWLFSDQESIYRGFGTVLLEKVHDRKTRSRIATALDFIGPSIKAMGFDASGTVAKTASAIKGLRSPEEIRNQVRRSISRDKRIFIVIDDLDRLEPTEILMIFKLIRLIGDIPEFRYVLLYDESTLISLLTGSSIANGSPTQARKYLEKFIDEKIAIPPLSETQKIEEITRSIFEFGESTSSEFGESEKRSLFELIRLLLLRKLNTIRVIERFISEIKSLDKQLYGELNFIDWVLIAYLRIVEPATIPLILHHHDSLTALNRTDAVDWFISGVESLDTDMLSNKELILVLTELFPIISHDYNSIRHLNRASKQRASSSEYFDRYFWTELPPGDISDMHLSKLLKQVRIDSNQSDEFYTNLMSYILNEPTATLEAIRRRWRYSIKPINLWSFATDLYSEASHNTRLNQWLILQEIRSISLEALRLLDEQDLTFILDSLNHHSNQIGDLLTDILTDDPSQAPAGNQYFIDWISRAKTQRANQITIRFRSLTAIMPSDAGNYSDALALYHLDKNQFVSLIQESVKCENLDPATLFSLYISTRTVDNKSMVSSIHFIRLLSDFSSDTLDGWAKKVEGNFPESWYSPRPLIEHKIERNSMVFGDFLRFALKNWRSLAAPTDIFD